MEERKKKEIEYYDKKAEEFSVEKKAGDFEGFEPVDLASFKALYQLIDANCSGKVVLDYGCGNGIHSFYPLKAGAKKVVGIDLSEKSLDIARERAKKQGFDNIEFLKMDCEKMDFPDSSFDVVLDSGTFSSLDSNVIYPELARVLKPEGVLLGIETFGHNPLTNLKRKLNKMTGKRTGWAAEHIFQEKDIERAGKYFGSVKVKYFHLISWILFPFLKFPGMKIVLKIAEFLDRVLFKLPFLRRYAFKVVIIFRNPQK